MTFIKAALQGGGVLTVKSVLPGKSIFNACVDWPEDGSQIKGNISTSIDGALQNLDGMLKQDFEKS